MLVLAVAFAFLILASLVVVEFSPQRPLHYSFAFGGFALFLVVGPRAAPVVLAASAVGALIRWLTHRTGAAGPRALLVAGAGIAAGIVAGHGVAQLLGVTYPLALGQARSLADYMAVLCASFVVFVVAKEAGNALVARSRMFAGGAGIYLAGLVFGAPIQLAAHALYLQDHLLPWTLALLWTLLVNHLIGREVDRLHRNTELAAELARKERLAAIGEMSARVLHHTRHQMGLVGMIAHQVERQLAAVPPAPAQAISEQMTKLRAVQEDLSQALAVDLGKPANEPNHASYEQLVRSEIARLSPLAAERKVAIRVEGELPEHARPKSGEKLRQAFLNVLDNAIAAAKSEVLVLLGLEQGRVLVSVRDDGPGMDDELLARATEPFVTTKANGTGMGLAITRAVVEEEEGALEIRNGDAGGLVVRMLLPSQLDVVASQ
jgi:signal transduction histidine kinase